jgi:hypothetical protein
MCLHQNGGVPTGLIFLQKLIIMIGTLYSSNEGLYIFEVYEGVSKSFRTGLVEREVQMIQLSATSCSCIAIL